MGQPIYIYNGVMDKPCVWFCKYCYITRADMKIYIGTYINHPDSFVIVTYNTTIGIHDMQL